MGETFTTEIQARYRDINLAGHVDNVEAVRVLDEARYEFLRFAPLPGLPEGGTGLLHGVDEGVSELVASQTIEYHAEMRFVPYQPFLASLWVTRGSAVRPSPSLPSCASRPAVARPPSGSASTSCGTTTPQSAWPLSDTVRADLGATSASRSLPPLSQAPSSRRTLAGPRARTSVGSRGPRSASTSRW